MIGSALRLGRRVSFFEMVYINDNFCTYTHTTTTPTLNVRNLGIDF